MRSTQVTPNSNKHRNMAPKMIARKESVLYCSSNELVGVMIPQVEHD